MDRKSDSFITENIRSCWNTIDRAFEELADVPLPQGYWSRVKADFVSAFLDAADPEWKSRRFCYLAFFGDGDEASYVKIGMSRSPSCRVKGLATGNPLKHLWTFACALPATRDACAVERAILDYHADRRAQGEWVAIDRCGYDAAKFFVLCTAPVAKGASDRFTGFFEVAKGE